jgi:hypothetical protein
VKKTTDTKKVHKGFWGNLLGATNKGALADIPTRQYPQGVNDGKVDLTPRYNARELKAIMGRASVDNSQHMKFFQNLQNSGMRDDLTDEQARGFAQRDNLTVGNIEPRPPGQDVAIVSHDITLVGNLNPKWLRISDLPGYMQQAIRAMGRHVFSQFTKTNIEEIDILSTITHDEIEVRAVMSWVSKNGIRDDQAKMDFSRFMTGVFANVQVWSTQDHTWLIVQDHAGYYVYRWTGGRGIAIKGNLTPLQIQQIEDTDFGSDDAF